MKQRSVLRHLKLNANIGREALLPPIVHSLHATKRLLKREKYFFLKRESV